MITLRFPEDTPHELSSFGLTMSLHVNPQDKYNDQGFCRLCKTELRSPRPLQQSTSTEGSVEQAQHLAAVVAAKEKPYQTVEAKTRDREYYPVLLLLHQESKHGKKVVGYLEMQYQEDKGKIKSISVDDLEVSETARRQGLATLLLKASVDIASEYGVTDDCYLFVEDALMYERPKPDKNLYDELGFVKAPPEYQEEGDDNEKYLPLKSQAYQEKLVAKHRFKFPSQDPEPSASPITTDI